MRKTIWVLILSFITSSLVHARGGGPDTEGDYIVPSPPHLVPYSRFKVQIVDRYQGPDTQKISYIFPEILTGEPARVVSLTRIPNTVNSWTSPELDAHCVVVDNDFSCNIYVHTSTTSSKSNAPCGGTLSQKALSMNDAIANLPRLGLSDVEVTAYSEVVQSFFCGEPGGILFYDID